MMIVSAAPSRHDWLIVAARFGAVPTNVLVPCASDGGHQFVAQQRPVLNFEMFELEAAIILLDQELMGAVAAAVACPVPQLKHNATAVRPVLDVLAGEAGLVHNQRIVVPDA